MGDHVLLSRLTALLNNLTTIHSNLEGQRWLPLESASKDGRAEWQEQLLWTGMDRSIKQWIRTQTIKLTEEIKILQEDAPKTKVESSDAWQRYDNMLRDSQSYLQECLEIIGTLAMRSKDLDEKLFHVADELINDCLLSSTGNSEYYLIVHGLGEAIPAKKAQIIRMRFPDWTIWELPLVAHELGHVSTAIILGKENNAPEADRYLTRFLDEQEKLIMGEGTELNEYLVEQKKKVNKEEFEQLCATVKKWAEGRVRKLAADAFATYTMGPAYACSAINLRFNPLAMPRFGTPSDAQRAHVVMSMLDWINNAEPGKAKLYDEVIGKLNEAWQSIMDLSEAESNLRATDKEYLTGFAHGFAKEVCRKSLITTAMYPRAGWFRVQVWCDNWGDTQSGHLPTADASGAKLRDVLNATWLHRINSKAESEWILPELARVGKKLCERIIAQKHDRGGLSTPPTSPKP